MAGPQSFELSVEFSLFCDSQIAAWNELSTLSGSRLETGPRIVRSRLAVEAARGRAC